MKRCIGGVLAATVMAVGLLTSAPQAAAGCLYGGPTLGRCDGPIQPDGTWQRCLVVAQWVPRGASSYLAPVKHCQPMGIGRPPADPNFAEPPVHIDG